MILAIHRQEPNWPATNDRPRFVVAVDDVSYWAETDGAEPSDEEISLALYFGVTSLDAAKTGIMATIDVEAEAARQRHLTPGAGMALVYAEKFAQAQAVDAMGAEAANAMSLTEREAQFPTLSASVGIEGATLSECADLVLEKYAQFAQLSLIIERARLSGKAAIATANDVQGVRAAYEAVVWPTP